MDVLRRADRRALLWGLGAWLAICVIGSFWALPQVESSLDERAGDIASLRAADGASIEFNGRDGYLSVPAGTQNAEQIASDIADIRGVRDVEIEVLGAVALPEDEASEEDDGAVEDDNEAAEPTPELSPASFSVEWDGDATTQRGAAPDELGGVLDDLGVGEPQTAADLTVGADVGSTLGALAPLIGTDLIDGTVTVDDDVVTVVGTAPDAEALERANAALAQVNADIDLRVDPAAEAAAETEADADADANEGADADGGADAGDSAQAAIDRLLALESIEFETNTATPTAATEAIIDEVATTLTEFPEVSIVITGHTDSRGDDAANQALSEARAQAVVDGLVESGIDADRLEAIGKGETEPIDSNDTAAGQQRNRRVDIDVEESA